MGFDQNANLRKFKIPSTNDTYEEITENCKLFLLLQVSPLYIQEFLFSRYLSV